jgi:uncharacterized protein (DUF427 family)
MTDKKVLTPGPEHPITVTPTSARVIVKAGDVVIADTRAALTLQEAAYSPVQYIPRKDVDMARLARSDRASYCPYKGEAGYFSLNDLGANGDNAVWTYEQPYPAVAEIAGHVAFYPDRVTITQEP